IPSFSYLSRTPTLPTPTLFPYTTLFRSISDASHVEGYTGGERPDQQARANDQARTPDATTDAGTRDATDNRAAAGAGAAGARLRSEEHTSELQSRFDLVCRLLLEKKNKS